MLDRGYPDNFLFPRWTREGMYFVCRLKANADVITVQSRPIPQRGGIRRDEINRGKLFEGAVRIWRNCAR